MDFFKDLALELKVCGIMPVFCPKSQRELDVFLDAVLATPVRVVEITLRNRFAVEALSQIKSHFGMTVAAGTILSKELFDTAVDAGADFLVSPGYSPVLMDYAKARGKAFLPGCATPSEIQNALLNGYSTLKYFPAECSGGTAALKLYEGAFADASFVPTGGITLENLPDYLAQKNVLACGGSFMLPKDMLAASDSEGIYQTIMKCLSIRGGIK